MWESVCVLEVRWGCCASNGSCSTKLSVPVSYCAGSSFGQNITTPDFSLPLAPPHTALSLQLLKLLITILGQGDRAMPRFHLFVAALAVEMQIL